MERKIGEIFEYNDEWYQCVESDSCDECSLFTTECGSGTKSDLAYKVFGLCSKARRSDNKYAICKKLEKVGEPFTIGDKLYLHVKVFDIDSIDFCLNSNMNEHNYNKKTVTIEIKRNQEDMEEKKLNLKPFSLEAAKAGKPVCTRDGRKARIICSDAKDITPIIALVLGKNSREEVQYYDRCGRIKEVKESPADLMMLPEKHEGWINVIKNQDNYYYCKGVFDSEEHARNNEANYPGLAVATVKIEWEE